MADSRAIGAAGVNGGVPRGDAGATASDGDTAAQSSTVPFDAGSDPNRNHVVAGSLCARISAIQCAGEAHCCSAPARTVSTCETTLRTACTNQLYLDTLAANPVTGFDSGTTATILDELESRSSQCDTGIAAWGVSPQGLRGILKGTIAPGASCKPPGTNLTDKPVLAAALASCTGLDTTACLPKALFSEWPCAPKNPVGSSCVTDDNCQPDMYCSNPSMNFLGKCAQRLALGSACKVGGTECSSLYCRAGQCVPPSVDTAYCSQ
jgi:hypothetical protein